MGEEGRAEAVPKGGRRLPVHAYHLRIGASDTVQPADLYRCSRLHETSLRRWRCRRFPLACAASWRRRTCPRVT